VLAVRDKAKKCWVYAGHVGTGFDAGALKSLYGRMQPLRTAKKPFDQKVKYENATTWLTPKLVCEVNSPSGRVTVRCAIPPFWGFAPTKGHLMSFANNHEETSQNLPPSAAAALCSRVVSLFSVLGCCKP
jgi:ATP-dependent DNA ligase